jgi:3-isopropylmalate/(R)-2-methylmalate dehydratase small subunit
VADLRKIEITGTGLIVRGNDIDTDRIFPARYLKCLTFDEVAEHVFEDDRAQLKAEGKTHPFDDPARQSATILFVNKNFGCGSSREHAAQALKRWGKGIQAIVGESFAEIFYANSLASGVPCVRVSNENIGKLFSACEASPTLEFSVNLANKTVSYGSESLPIDIDEGPRQQLMSGRWDATIELLDAIEDIRQKADSLAYFGGWA